MLVSRRKPISGGGGVSPTRAINTAIPLLGGGDLSVDRTHTFGPFNNNQFVQSRKLDNTIIDLIGISNSDQLEIGDSDVSITNTNGRLYVRFMGNAIGSGLRLPNLTTANVTAEPTPVSGLVIYNTTLGAIQYYNGSSWITLTSGSFVPITRNINTTSPLTGGGALSADLTIALGPFNNNAFLQGKLTTTLIKNLIGYNGSDNLFIGDTGIGGIYLNGAPTVLVFNGSGVGSGLILPSFTNAEELAEPTTEGKVIYNTTLNVIKYWDGTQWVTLGVSTSALNVTRMVISAKTIRSDSGIAEVHGAAPWVPAEHDISGTRKIYFRAILESEIGGTDVFVKLFNATTQLYVTNLDGLGNDFLKTNLTAPTLLISHDLNGVGGDNFNELATGIYEAHYYTSDANVYVIIHFSEIIVKA